MTSGMTMTTLANPAEKSHRPRSRLIQVDFNRSGSLGAGSTYHFCSAVVVSLPAQAGSRFVCSAAGFETSNPAKQGNKTFRQVTTDEKLSDSTGFEPARL